MSIERIRILLPNKPDGGSKFKIKSYLLRWSCAETLGKQARLEQLVEINACNEWRTRKAVRVDYWLG